MTCLPDGPPRIWASRPSFPPDPGAGPFVPDQRFRRGRIPGAGVQPDQPVSIRRIRSPGRTESTPFAPALKLKRPSGTSISRDWNAAGCSSAASPTCWPRTILAISSSACSAYPAAHRPAGGIIHAYRETNLNAFVQDDYKVSAKLTVNLGVRWEYDGTFGEKYAQSDQHLDQPVGAQFASADVRARLAGAIMPDGSPPETTWRIIRNRPPAC